MIARVLIPLPFFITVLTEENYVIYESEISGYNFRILPPLRSPQAASLVYELSVDERTAIQVDVLHIEFRKSDFMRDKNSPPDPPLDLILQIGNAFIRRLRSVAVAPRAMPLLELSNFRIEYLNDDGSPLPDQEGLRRGLVKWGYAVDCIILDEAVWKAVNELPLDFEPTPWDELVLDARAQLPNVGTAIALGYTALEVMIDAALDRLASDKVQPLPLWEWVNDRGFWLREPTVQEKFDSLLKIVGGTSLKSTPLWESFSQLKDARNSFVHDGKPLIKGKLVDVLRTQELLKKTEAIISFVLGLLPEGDTSKSYKITGVRHYINVRVPVPKEAKFGSEIKDA